MPICIAGMHRSGTSLVAQLLNVCGVDLGPEADLLPANEFNRDGYWENRRFVELNDSLLEAAGGAWDMPIAPPDWSRLPLAPTFRAEADALLAALALSEPWGWKDPRNSLTIGFWRDVVPDLRVVVCLRHPLEVALSLRRRGSMSVALGLRLWTAYNRTLLDTVPPEQRVVTDFERYFKDPEGELQRVSEQISLAAAGDVFALAALRAQANLRTEWQGTGHAGLADLPAEVRDLYVSLCVEAETLPRGVLRPHRSAAASRRVSSAEPLVKGHGPEETVALTRSRLRGEIEGLHRELEHWRREAHGLTKDRDNWRAMAERLTAQAEDFVAEQKRLGAEAGAVRLQSDALGKDLDIWRATAERLTAQGEQFLTEQKRLRDEARELRQALENWQVLGETPEAAAALIRAQEDTVADRDRWQSEASALREERDRWQAAAEHFTAQAEQFLTEQRRFRDEARELRQMLEKLTRARDDVTADRDRWRSESGAVGKDRDIWRVAAERLEAELRGTTADRDNWRQEVEGLRQDRDNWRTEAENWRRETLRLLDRHERMLSHRLRRVGFRLARRIWWALPGAFRDFLRPIIFRSARASASAGPRNGRPPSDDTSASPTAAPSMARDRRATSTLRVATPISIVVPTLNGGRVFERLLRSIARQQGLRELELVIVDSGSTDDTVELAEQANARIVSIPKDEFGHGRTRNQGAALATGEALVMMVQDAVLLGPTALRDLVLELYEDERIAAVSSRQIPRSDADLYAAFTVYAHYKEIWGLGGSNGRRAGQTSSPLERRAAASVDDVCAAVRRSAWEEVQFSDVRFAEDLDFGVRAVDRGWSVRLSRTAAVAHSHTRDAIYHLRRSIADRLYVAPLVGDRAVSLGAASGLRPALASGTTLLSEVQGAISLALTEEAPLVYDLSEIRRLIESGAPRMPPSATLASLAALLETKHSGGDGVATLGHLRRELIALLDWPPLTAFARAQRHVAPQRAADFVASLAASVLGRVIGDALRVEEDSQGVQRFLVGV